MPTLEDATYCPKCGQQGIKQMEKSAPKGGKLFVFHCQNAVCPWFETGWTVQTKSDGSVYERDPGPKMFEKLSPTDKAIAEKMLREVENG